ncbi:MAG: DUF58 domain-containing protein [Planctomycetes bacterium]|nr:DUF58 domain-containing protein [Planctomycetota bacterium]
MALRIGRGEFTARARFAPDFARRLERFVARLAGSRERREGARAGRGSGDGAEFVGFRPYRPGEDLRRLDWSLFARLDRPFVRVTRREVGGEWLVWLDASASMALGAPTKWQRAAELAATLACVGVRAGARVRLECSSRRDARFEFTRVAELPRLLRFLESVEAAGSEGLAQLVRPVPRVSALYCIGDGLDVEPATLTRLAGPARNLGAVWILAPDELAPDPRGAVRWVEPETGATVELDVDSSARRRYLVALEARLERWRSELARVGASLVVAASTAPFEDSARELLGGAW